MVIVGGCYRWGRIRNEGRYGYGKQYVRCPYHPDLLENWEQFIEDLKSNNVSDLEKVCIQKVMLPTSPFFSTKIMPILTSNITTITHLELVNCDIKPADIDPLSKFVKKNQVLAILNLSKNAIFSNDDVNCVAAKLLAKSTQKHPELALVNLTKTGLGHHNGDLKIMLEGCKELNSLIIDDNAVDKEGLGIIQNFLKKKNEVTVFSMCGFGIGEGEKANAKVLKETFEKNTSIEQLCLGSNFLGSNDRILSTVLSGIKASASLTHRQRP